MLTGQFWAIELMRQVVHEPAGEVEQTVKKGMEETHILCKGRDQGNNGVPTFLLFYPHSDSRGLEEDIGSSAYMDMITKGEGDRARLNPSTEQVEARH